MFRRHTRSYVKKLGGLKVIPVLPRRKSSKKVASYTKDSNLGENLEELVDLSIQEIVQPLDQLDPDSRANSVFSQSPPHCPPQIMADVNKTTWRARTPLILAAPLHDLPKHPEKILPKFDPRKGVSAEDHLHNFYLGLNLLNVDPEDVVCIFFSIYFLT